MTLPWLFARNACAQSSMTGMPFEAARLLIASISQGLPKRCVTIIAFVRALSIGSIVFAVTFHVLGSTSANTGTAAW